MITIILEMWYTFVQLILSPFHHGGMAFAFKFIPYVVFLELPVYFVVFLGIFRYFLRKDQEIPENRRFSPSVSCIVLCYSEGDDVKLTIVSLAEQLYAGHIEILAMIDGSVQNAHTYKAAMEMLPYVKERPNRTLRVIPKYQRGGRVSSLNTGLSMASGEIVMALDGDTSFDNTMVRAAAPHFEDPNVAGVAGILRVRNALTSLVTRLQAVEYMLSIHASKVGLGEFNIINNISGAFGIFRKSFLEKVGGWDTGTAEDLDLTMRIKHYFGRHPNLRIRSEPKAMGHTDAPDTFWGFYGQRLRWDGDLYYLYCRKHPLSFNPRILGWKNMIMQLWTGLFFQIISPFIIIAYTAFTFFVYSTGFLLGVMALIYLFYFIITATFFVVYITMVSERKKQDLKLSWVLPLVPFFTFSMRIWNGIATAKEIFVKQHLDSSMAPWWVLKKGKFSGLK